MADQEYSIVLDDEVSPGLKRILNQLNKLDKEFNKKVRPSALSKTAASAQDAVTKLTQSSKHGSDSINKIEKGLSVFNKPIGQIANRFGFLGDTLEGVSGRLLNMGGKAGVVGLGMLAAASIAAVYAASLYAIGKAALYSNEEISKQNKSLLTIRGNLGKYTEQTKAVIEASMKMNAAIGKPYEEVAEQIAKAVKLGTDLNTATDFASLSLSMQNYGEAGKKVSDVLDQLATGKRFTKTKEDIDKVQYALNQVGLGNKVKAIDFINIKSAKKQLEMITSYKEGIKAFAKESADTVPLMDKLKATFGNLIAKVFGASQENPFEDTFRWINEWANNPENIQKVRSFFDSMNTGFNHMLEKLPGLLDKLLNILDAAERIFKIMGLIDEKPLGLTPGQTLEAKRQVDAANAPVQSSGITLDKNGNLQASPTGTSAAAPVIKPFTVSAGTDYYRNMPPVAKTETNISNKIDIKVESMTGDPTEIAKEVGKQLDKRIKDAWMSAGGG